MKLYVFWMALVAMVLFTVQRDQGLEKGHVQMCEKIKDNFVEELTAEEFEQCKSLYARSISFKSWEENTNSWLATWGWSHLAVYSPSESDEIWSSKSESIGVKLKSFEGKQLVYRAHPSSVFKRGDVFLKVNGKLNPSYDDIMHAGGEYTVERKNKEITLSVEVKNYTWNDKVEIKKNIIKVPSFRGEFFKDESVVEIINQLNSVKEDELYVDLRDNYGGNIAAGLRFLAMFLCEEKVVGEFNIPSKREFGESNYPLSIKQSIQVEHLKKYGKVFLKVPKIKECISKKVSVLVNSSTSSTAELVAQAFIDTNRGKVIGEQTSGRMVLSSWDQVPNFPDGFYFSYPYALYKSLSGAEIEKEGVLPDEYKTYSFDLERMGKDSFIN